MTMLPSGRALLVSTDDEPLDEIELDLREHGFEVVRCHEPGRPSFPCAALIDGRRCPLDAGAGAGVDVTVDVRHHAWPYPTVREQGVTCSLRAGVPLVVVGRERHPFAGWSTAIDASDHVGDRARQAIADSLEPLRLAAATAVRAVIDRHAGGTPFAIEIDRTDGHIRVRIVARLTNETANLAVVRAMSAVRSIDASTSTIDVGVVEPI